ncbi:MAG: transporter substrate-binding domain-containing protein [Deltaproteobacteria bacterium]|nr:transporter substrate-binding domain-containing protein [Deltaproteobacteria bacterium]
MSSSSVVVRLLLALVLTAIIAPASVAEAAQTPRSLRVGIKEAPPFVVRRTDGTLEGPSLRLWRELAAELGLTYRFEERDLTGLLDGLRDGSLDAAVAAITVTSERETTLDFTHPFHTASLGIAVRRERIPLWGQVGRSLLSGALLQLVAVLAGLQLLVGALVWRIERRANPDQFGAGGLRGLLSGFWWSTVTMTTVGYGDKAPVTTAGRTVALGWMLCSVVIISTFTATVASNMTVAQLGSEIAGPADLARFRVAVVSNTTSESYAHAAGLDYRRFADLDAAIKGLTDGRIDAVIHDSPLLEQRRRGALGDAVEILPSRFQRQDYAIALPDGSDLREPINRLLPATLRGGELDDPQLFDPGR